MISEETERSTTGPAESVEKPAPATTEGVHAVLWTREPVCGRRTEAIDRLSDLRAAGVVEPREVVRLPMLCLAVYDDGLAGMVPCADGGRRWTVPDMLDAALAEETVELPPE